MSAFQLKKRLIIELIGLADETALVGDEEVLGTINVRLESMFRELVVSAANVALVPASELEKIAQHSELFRSRAKVLRADSIRVDLQEGLGVSDKIVADINAAPRALLSRCMSLGEMTLVQPPLLDFKHNKKTATFLLWTRLVMLPTGE